MTEVFFYHLKRRTPETSVPSLAEKCLSRDWRVLICTSGPERRDALDQALWTFRDDSFLPHACAGGDFSSDQSILISDEIEGDFQADVRISVDRFELDDIENLARAIYLFSDHDEEAKGKARDCWRAASAQHEVSYWLEDQQGQFSQQK